MTKLRTRSRFSNSRPGQDPLNQLVHRRRPVRHRGGCGLDHPTGAAPPSARTASGARRTSRCGAGVDRGHEGRSVDPNGPPGFAARTASRLPLKATDVVVWGRGRPSTRPVNRPFHRRCPPTSSRTRLLDTELSSGDYRSSRGLTTIPADRGATPRDGPRDTRRAVPRVHQRQDGRNRRIYTLAQLSRSSYRPRTLLQAATGTTR